jgi:hypothetical protein
MIIYMIANMTPEQKKIFWMVVRWLFLGAFLMIVFIWSYEITCPASYLLLETKQDRYVIMKIDHYQHSGKYYEVFSYPREK